jgi:citrate lyase subunit beta/citryl-CoA lyase
MNPIATGLGEADLAATIAGRPEGYVVPKPRHAGDVRQIAEVLDRLEHEHGLAQGSTKLVLIATETPEGLLNIREVSTASPRIVAVSWGIEDLSAAMGLPRVRDAHNQYLDIPRYARVMCSVVASAAGVEAIDTVYTDIADLAGLRRECEDGVAMGFSGKISIHPSQIEVINAAFTPAKAILEEARELVAAFEEARRFGGDFCLATHYWEIDDRLAGILDALIEHAERAGVEWVPADALFTDGRTAVVSSKVGETR